MTRQARERTWRRSSYSDAQGNGDCVEVASRGDGTAVRDSKARDSGWLHLGTTAWLAFLDIQQREV